MYSKKQVPFLIHFHLGESPALYLTHTIRTLALSLVGIYLPIYIFTLPNKFIFITDPFLNGLFWVLFYFLGRSLTVVVAILLLGNLIFARLNFKGSIFLSSILLILQVSFWLLAANWPPLIFWAAVLAGLNAFFYWIPYHIFFIRKTAGKDGRFGQETSLRVFLVRLANIVGPLLGGIMIAVLGFNSLFLSSILLLIASAVPILVSVHENHHHRHQALRILSDYLFNKKYRRISLALAGTGVDTIIYAIFWPILMFVVLQNFVKIGAITSLSVLLSFLTVLWVGRAIDRYGSRLVHGVGVFFNSVLYLPRIFLTSPFFVYAIDVLDRFNSAFYSVPFISEVYEKARRLGRESDFIIYRVLTVHIFMVVAIVASLLALPVFSNSNWQWIFVLAAVGSALTYFLTLDRN